MSLHALRGPSTSAIERVQTDDLSPAQRFANRAMETCDRTIAHGNQVIILWVPSHSRVVGDEMADT